MITLKDVPLWVISHGIGHIVLQSNSHWIHTPHSLMVGNPTQKEIPKRICKQCRAALARITPHEKTLP